MTKALWEYRASVAYIVVMIATLVTAAVLA